MTNLLPYVWAVFADKQDARARTIDLICYTAAEAKSHMKDLREMGHEPVMRTFPSEEAAYDWAEAKG